MNDIIEKIQALEPGRIYLLSVNFANCDIGLLNSLLDEAHEKHNIDYICVDKNTVELISAPEDLRVMLGKIKGLQRIRIFNKVSKNEHDVPEVEFHWLLEDIDKYDFFMVLSKHRLCGVEIEKYEKAQYRYEEEEI